MTATIAKDIFVEEVAALADRVGRTIDASNAKLLKEHLEGGGVDTHDFARGMRHLRLTWENGYWPSPEAILATCRRLAAESRAQARPKPARTSDEENAASAKRAQDAMEAVARRFKEAHPDEYKAIKDRVYAEFNVKWRDKDGNPKPFTDNVKTMRRWSLVAALVHRAREMEHA